MQSLRNRLLLAAAMVFFFSYAVAAETYVVPGLSLHNTVDKAMPKAFYKYLTVDIGHRSRNNDTVLSLNWLDNVQVLTAYRIAYPYQLKSTWQLTGQDALQVTAMTVHPVSESIEATDIVETRYTRRIPVDLRSGVMLDLSGTVRSYPSEGWAVELSPGAAVRKDVKGGQVSLALNGLDAKDYATLSRDSNVVSVGGTWGLPGGSSKVNATLNTLLGPGEPAHTKTWLDIRFLFGALYDK